MKIIVYKKREDFYECSAIKDSREELSSIIFDEPINGKLKLGERILPISGGVCRLDLNNLLDGEYSPVLIKDKRLFKMEEIIIKGAGAQKKTLGEEYLRSLSERIEKNRKRLCRLEALLKDISEKIERKITF